MIVTGHSKGIGKVIFENFENSVGFSRSNNFDITDKKDRTSIITKSENHKLFINNAFSYDDPFAQVNLLYEFWEVYKNTDKFIINISSDVTNEYINFKSKYSSSKHALNEASNQLHRSPFPCKVSNLIIGFTKTENSIIRNNNSIHKKKYFMDPLDIVDIINSIITWKHNPESIVILPKEYET